MNLTKGEIVSIAIGCTVILAGTITTILNKHDKPLCAGVTLYIVTLIFVNQIFRTTGRPL